MNSEQVRNRRLDDLELLDVVNERDEVVGVIERGQPTPKGCFVRCINVFVLNEAIRIWVPRRAMTIGHDPGALDFSIGEYVRHGETYHLALLRGAIEESGLIVENVDCRELGKVMPKDTSVDRRIIQNYEIILHDDQAPRLIPSQHKEAFWLTPQELIARIDTGDKARSDLKESIVKFYLQ